LTAPALFRQPHVVIVAAMLTGIALDPDIYACIFFSVFILLLRILVAAGVRVAYQNRNVCPQDYLHRAKVRRRWWRGAGIGLGSGSTAATALQDTG